MKTHYLTVLSDIKLAEQLNLKAQLLYIQKNLTSAVFCKFSPPVPVLSVVVIVVCKAVATGDLTDAVIVDLAVDNFILKGFGETDIFKV